MECSGLKPIRYSSLKIRTLTNMDSENTRYIGDVPRKYSASPKVSPLYICTARLSGDMLLRSLTPDNIDGKMRYTVMTDTASSEKKVWSLNVLYNKATMR